MEFVVYALVGVMFLYSVVVGLSGAAAFAFLTWNFVTGQGPRNMGDRGYPDGRPQ